MYVCVYIYIYINSTRSPFVTLLSLRAQSGRRTSFGRRVWFIGSQILFFYLLIYLFIYS